jgi:hypothetical protein
MYYLLRVVAVVQVITHLVQAQVDLWELHQRP